jgi:transposase
MSKSYRPWAPEQSYLLPPSPTDWLPEGHLAYFVLEVVRELDISAIEGAIQEKDSRGTRPYSPRMMTALLLYAYSVGVFSSRKIERGTYEDVAFRVIAAGQQPVYTTINGFRLDHRDALSGLFLHRLFFSFRSMRATHPRPFSCDWFVGATWSASRVGATSIQSQLPRTRGGTTAR